MDNTIQLYVDKKKGIKGYPITSPDRVIDENGVNIKDYVDEAINDAKLEGGDVQVDLSTYAKKTDLHSHSNKTILDSITTSKVNQWDSKSDFNGDYNDLTNKPTIPTKTSQLTNDSGFITTVPSEYITETELNAKGYLTQHQDISHKADKTELHSHSNKNVLDGITTSKITEWNNKSNFSGNYNDLTNKPAIPTKTSQLTNDEGYLTSIPSEYVTDSELNSKGYLTEHQDISGKVDKVNGYSLVNDAEIDRLATLENYDDTEIRELVDEINTSLDNITNRVEYIENNGSGGGSTGGSLNLRDVLDGEIFTIGTIDTPTTPTVTYGQIVVSKSSTTITEGSTDTFTVKLDKAPTNNQVVTLNKNNSDVTLSSYSLTFTPSNYSKAQTVTITVAEDDIDYSNETCTITISSPNVSTKTLIVNITDNDEEPPANIPVSSVSLDRSSHELEVGQTIQLTATVLPSNATNKSITWTASNSNCTVDNGLVEAINSGSCVITCTTVDGNKTASCNITIPAVEPEIPSNATLIHEWDLTETGSTIEDKVNNLDLVVNGNLKQISRYDNQGQLNTNFILSESESFSLDLLVTPKTVYDESIIHTGHVGGVNITKPGETNYYRFTLGRGISHGNNKGLLFIDYRLENNTSERIAIENSQTTKDVQTNIKLIYNADKTEFKVYQEDNLIYTDNRPYKISGFNFTKADYCKVYKGCII